MAEKRLSPSRMGYGKDWQRLRRWHLTREPLCRYCAQQGRVTAAVAVDHIEPIKKAPERRLDPAHPWYGG